MFKFNDWILTSSVRVLPAYQYDSKTISLEVVGDFPEGWDWSMKIRAGENWDILSMDINDTGLTYELERDHLSVTGVYDFQLRATKGDLVKHTNIVSLYVPNSLPEGDVIWPTIPSEFTDVEDRIRSLYHDASDMTESAKEIVGHPPVPGENGFWLLWDAEKNKYVESECALPESASPLMLLQAGVLPGTYYGPTPAEIYDHVMNKGGTVLMAVWGADGTHAFILDLKFADLHEESVTFSGSFTDNFGDSTMTAVVTEDGAITVNQTWHTYLTQENLQDGVDLALKQAKESGEFKGEPGEPGKDGKDGEPGKDGERGPAGPAGADGKDNLPDIVTLSGAAVTVTMDHNVEYHCTDTVTALTINGFTPAEDGKASLWSMQFTAGDTITVTLPDYVKWSVAEPVFVPGVSYWLSFVPLISGDILGVWVSDES